MSEGSRVLVAIRVKAPVERAFTAFTEQIGQWWQPSDLFPITPGRTGTMTFETGEHGRLLETYADGSEFVIGAVRLWEPPHRLVVGWRQATFPADQDTELHVSFTEVAAEPAETRVTVEHFGWDRLPPESAARHGFPLQVFQLRYAQWWQHLLRRCADVAS